MKSLNSRGDIQFMNLFLFTLESVASMIVDPLFISLLILMGIILFFNNKKLTIIQKMVIEIP